MFFTPLILSGFKNGLIQVSSNFIVFYITNAVSKYALRNKCHKLFGGSVIKYALLIPVDKERNYK